MNRHTLVFWGPGARPAFEQSAGQQLVWSDIHTVPYQLPSSASGCAMARLSGLYGVEENARWLEARIKSGQPLSIWTDSYDGGLMQLVLMAYPTIQVYLPLDPFDPKMGAFTDKSKLYRLSKYVP